MAVKREWLICGSVYKTAKSIEDRVKTIKSRLSFGVQITKGDDDFEFMLELYKKYYPRKETREIKENEIMDLTVAMNSRSSWSSSSPTFFWIDCHGFLDNWNPAECWKPKPSNKNLARIGFRRAIQPQCTAFYKRVCNAITNELPLCPITGKPFDPRLNQHSQVHHLLPEFKDILQGFAETTGIDIDTVEVRKVPSDGWELADKTIEMMFADYHEIHARLQVVSKEGHDIVTYKRRDSA